MTTGRNRLSLTMISQGWYHARSSTASPWSADQEETVDPRLAVIHFQSTKVEPSPHRVAPVRLNCLNLS